MKPWFAAVWLLLIAVILGWGARTSHTGLALLLAFGPALQAGRKLGWPGAGLAAVVAAAGLLAGADWTGGHTSEFWAVGAVLLISLQGAREVAAIGRVAQTDPLTGLLNRDGFLRRLSSLHRPGGALAVGYLDCDDFKRFNDQHGHLAGDDYLMAVSLSLRQMLGSSTLVARMGGDEFAVALPGLDLAQTCHVGERLLAALNQTGDPARRASWSLGLAWFPAPRGAREMLEHADQALLAAKRSGGGSLRVADCSAMPGTAGAAE